MYDRREGRSEELKRMMETEDVIEDDEGDDDEFSASRTSY